MANRIKVLSDLVVKNSIVADIGTDHAYLLIELLKNKKIKYGYGIDNKEGPILNAINNVKARNLETLCEIIKADGLDFNLNENVDTLVFAGIGGMNVISIIEKDKSKLKNIKYIITDIHRNEERVKNYIYSLNYQIDNEIEIMDKKEKYHLVRYKKNEV